MEKYSEVNQAKNPSVETDLSACKLALFLPFEYFPEVTQKTLWKAWNALYGNIIRNVQLVVNYPANDLEDSLARSFISQGVSALSPVALSNGCQNLCSVLALAKDSHPGTFCV